MKQFIKFDDNCVKPIRTSQTRWVKHELPAMKRILSIYDEYTHHLAALSVDHSIKSVDREKLKDYYLHWTNAKYLLGCTLFTDILTPCSVFSKVMQNDEADIVAALTGLIKTLCEMETLSSKPLTQWPTYSATKRKFTKQGDKMMYQSQEVKSYGQAKEFCVNHHEDICKNVNEL